MPLFQKSVLNKFLKAQDQNVISKAYKKFSKHFHNSIIQENIRNSKEEQYQEGFLRELFVDVFGYVLNPQPNFNLSTEFKNEKGAKKADGAIFKHGKALGVIELKGTDTKDLEKVRQQAFDYKANQSECVYVITSNFEKLRFYINNAVEFEEFDLFTLTEKQFELLYLCLAAENLLEHVPLKIKEASVVEEENITKKFYADYSLFKRELFRDLVKKNLRNDVFRGQLLTEETTKADKNIKLLLFKKSQKLIDRFLFIFFAEDRGLLPPNSTHRILDDWNKLKDLDAAVPLYDRFKLYFNFLDTGRKGTAEKAEIFAYNGGLFKPDGTLDSLKIDDELLYKHTKALASYDFESQVDVNILGHIFENSLNEIESVNAEIEGTDFDKQKTKRKKDGVFYTPKYITKYIVDNTVGKLCTEKRAALGIIDEEFTKNRQKETKKKLLEKLDEYRAWLLELTICDPACGSGAFLNQALDFLINEHRSVDELQASLLGGSLVFQEIENTILEKNIYGVDLNEESVEIAKLSLWLRTAQPRRKLNDLNNNIKCGNSLIESKAVAGDKAFKWEEEFPEVFARGGFDVVIGNPPYVRQELFKEIKPYLEQKYACYNSVADLYTYFIEKGITLMNQNGIFSFILPNKFIKATYGKEIRKVITSKSNLELIYDFDDFPVFSDATTYPIIFVLNKKRQNPNNSFWFSAITKKSSSEDPLYSLNFNRKEISLNSLNEDSWNFDSHNETVLNEKLFKNSIPLYQLVEKGINRGVLTGKNEVFIFDEARRKILLEEGANTNLIKPILLGSAIKRYHYHHSGDYLLFTRRGTIIEDNPVIEKYLRPFYNDLRPRNNGESTGRKPGPYKWFEIQDNIAYYKDFEEPKIIYPRTNNQCNFQLDLDGNYLSDNNFYIKNSSKTLLGILNSKLIFHYLKGICTTLQGGYFDFRRDKIDTIPIKAPFVEIDAISNLVEAQIALHSTKWATLSQFQNYLKSNFTLVSLSKKLQSWHDLTFSEFINELNKAIKTAGGTKLSKLQEMEWMEVFETKQKEALALKAEIERVDKEIDQMVYELYGLTDEEIAIVDQS